MPSTKTTTIRTPARSTTVAKRQRTYKRKSRRAPNYVRLGKQPIPKILFNTLKYCEAVTISTNLSGLGSYLFTCNGLYDPNTSGTGHQPLYYDQLIALYDHWTVYKSKITIKWQPSDTFSYKGIAFIDDDTAINVTAGYVANERTGAKNVLVPKDGGGEYITTAYWNAEATFGPNYMANDNLQGYGASNPVELSYFCAYVDGSLGGGSAGVNAWVEIEYQVVWDEWKSIDGS